MNPSFRVEGVKNTGNLNDIETTDNDVRGVASISNLQNDNDVRGVASISNLQNDNDSSYRSSRFAAGQVTISPTVKQLCLTIAMSRPPGAESQTGAGVAFSGSRVYPTPLGEVRNYLPIRIPPTHPTDASLRRIPPTNPSDESLRRIPPTRTASMVMDTTHRSVIYHSLLLLLADVALAQGGDSAITRRAATTPLPAGEIAGIAVTAVVAYALYGYLIFHCRQKRKRMRLRAQEAGGHEVEMGRLVLVPELGGPPVVGRGRGGVGGVGVPAGKRVEHGDGERIRDVSGGPYAQMVGQDIGWLAEEERRVAEEQRNVQERVRALQELRRLQGEQARAKDDDLRIREQQREIGRGRLG
ncbi:hypothetical protein BZA05DRAFT_435971 [Tricharina praecox]|uniref:uncharacterized protein n=1 Tax=Tricharina praecox TaxID=43433 RepID=UPI00222082A2|nr:uncharacterized protein BZA05DRAFT_435971 [Tricharina praecox]KAI5853619.1 hypothetical protein BZA05DRAFT_435971 [Tricharina praecox]